jgi:hypothetical protein
MTLSRMAFLVVPTELSSALRGIEPLSRMTPVLQTGPDPTQQTRHFTFCVTHFA